MEEPDFDELEWMAQGQFPDEEDFEPPEDLDEFEGVFAIDLTLKLQCDPLQRLAQQASGEKHPCFL